MLLDEINIAYTLGLSGVVRIKWNLCKNTKSVLKVLVISGRPIRASHLKRFEKRSSVGAIFNPKLSRLDHLPASVFLAWQPSLPVAPKRWPLKFRTRLQEGASSVVLHRVWSWLAECVGARDRTQDWCVRS